MLDDREGRRRREDEAAHVPRRGDLGEGGVLGEGRGRAERRAGRERGRESSEKVERPPSPLDGEDAVALEDDEVDEAARRPALGPPRGRERRLDLWKLR